MNLSGPPPAYLTSLSQRGERRETECVVWWRWGSGLLRLLAPVMMPPPRRPPRRLVPGPGRPLPPAPARPFHPPSPSTTLQNVHSHPTRVGGGAVARSARSSHQSLQPQPTSQYLVGLISVRITTSRTTPPTKMRTSLREYTLFTFPPCMKYRFLTTYFFSFN